MTVEAEDNRKYEIRVYIRGQPGFYKYNVTGRTRAMVHFGEITTGGYRRVNEQGRFDWFSPSRINEVNIIGEDLGTSYPDEFVRT